MSKNKILPKLDLNITNRCNFKCKHCAFDSGIIEMSELSLGELEKILRETKELGGKRVDITGGEPLVRKDVGNIISLCKKFDYKTELVTNVSLLTKEKLNKFKKLGLDAIAISLDGSNSEIYNRIRCEDKETFNKVIKNIYESKKLGFYTKVNTTVFASNLKDVPNTTKLCLKLRVDEHGLYYFTPIGRGNRTSEKAVEPLKWLNFIREKLKPYSNSKIKVSLEYPLIEKEHWNSKLGCIANGEQNHLQILPDGNVYPCAILASYGEPVANLKEKSIKEVWNNENLWENYWKDLSQLFENLGHFCVDFNAFNIKNYTGYEFVCPLRKFNLKNIK